MASPLSADLLECWRSKAGTRYTLVKLELTDPSALTLYWGSSEITTPDGTTWETGLLKAGPISFSGQHLSTEVVPHTCEFTFADRRHSAQTSGTLLDTLVSHRWHGAYITVYRWHSAMTANPEQRFRGQIFEFVQGRDRVLVRTMTRQDWNRRLPALEVTRSLYPRAPEKSIGQPVPLIYGNHLTLPARSPASSYGAFNADQIYGAGGRLGVRGVVALMGRGNGGEKGLVLFASHSCKTFDDESAGAWVFIENEDKLCALLPASTDDINISGCGIYIDNMPSGGTYPFDPMYSILPTDVRLPASNGCDNPLAIMDPFNETSYASFDYNNNRRSIDVLFPSVILNEIMREVFLIVGYRTSAGATKVRVDVSFNGGSFFYILPASTTPAGDAQTLGTSWGVLPLPTSPYDFAQRVVTLGFNGVATGETFDVFYCLLSVKFVPDHNVLQPQRVTYSGERVPAQPIRLPGGEIDRKTRYEIHAEITPPVIQVDGAFYATLAGYEDDGTPYTAGGAGTLVEVAPDVLRHMLLNHLGQSSGQIETGGGVFGSLVDARDLLKTWRHSDMVTAAAITDFRQASDIIADIGLSALSWPILSPFTDRWLFVPWVPGKDVDYDYTLAYDRRDVLGNAIECSFAASSAFNDLEVRYGFDDRTRRPILSTYCSGGHETTEGRSSAGYLYRNLRDELLTVIVAENDRIDFTDSAARTATLTAGDYENGGDLASEAQTQMRAAAGGGRVPFVSYGFHIIGGFNDAIDMVENGVNLTATITPGYYATGAELAAAVGGAMNAASLNASTYSCTFSETTRKFTISQAGAIGILNSFTFAAAAANFLTCAAMPLGFNFAGNSYPDTSDYEVESENFYFDCSGGSCTLNWETGANGLNAGSPRSAAALFGHDPVRDRAISGRLTPHCPKGAREQLLRASAERYGKRRQRAIDARYIKDTDTAREVRNRIIGLAGGDPPLEIKFATDRMPDIEPGRVVGFSSDWDALFPCPVPGGSGSWADGRFAVVEYLDHLEGPMHQEVRAIDVSQ